MKNTRPLPGGSRKPPEAMNAEGIIPEFGRGLTGTGGGKKRNDNDQRAERRRILAKLQSRPPAGGERSPAP